MAGTEDGSGGTLGARCHLTPDQAQTLSRAVLPRRRGGRADAGFAARGELGWRDIKRSTFWHAGLLTLQALTWVWSRRGLPIASGTSLVNHLLTN